MVCSLALHIPFIKVSHYSVSWMVAFLSILSSNSMSVLGEHVVNTNFVHKEDHIYCASVIPKHQSGSMSKRAWNAFHLAPLNFAYGFPHNECIAPGKMTSRLFSPSPADP